MISKESLILGGGKRRVFSKTQSGEEIREGKVGCFEELGRIGMASWWRSDSRWALAREF